MKFISSLITAASGSVAGSTYSRNANGAYIRNKAIPTNPNTLSQQAARARFSSVSTGWKALTNSQRQTWIDSVGEYPYIDALGQTKTYTGSQLYKHLNGALIQAGYPSILNCMPPVSLLNMGAILLQADQSTPDILFSSFEFADMTSIVPDECALVIYATAPLPASITNVKRSAFRQIAVAAATDDMGGATWTPQYEALFGDGWRTTPAIVNNIWFAVKLVNVQTGQAYGNLFQASCTINV